MTEKAEEAKPVEQEEQKQEQEPIVEEKPKEERPLSSEETSDATKKAEVWTFSMGDEIVAETPVMKLKKACIQFRRGIMSMPGARGIRCKEVEGAPMVIIRVGHRQTKWENTPEFLHETETDCESHPNMVAEYYIVEDGKRLEIDGIEAKVRVVSKKPKLKCLGPMPGAIGGTSPPTGS